MKGVIEKKEKIPSRWGGGESNLWMLGAKLCKLKDRLKKEKKPSQVPEGTGSHNKAGFSNRLVSRVKELHRT